MASRDSDEQPDGKPLPSAAAGTAPKDARTLGDEAPTDGSAFDRLLEEAARVSSPGRLLAPGTKLCDGRFVIQRRIGEGGMGVVFEALDTQTETRVALKTLSRVDASGIYRLKGEFRSLADVLHPYLVAMQELFADDELWFFTMELIDGVPFDEAQRKEGGLDERALRMTLGQLTAGVQAIHDAGKVHRDLKPSNVLVAAGTDAPRVAILDFGLTSEVATPGVTQTIERGVAGTPAYMAPEQARGQGATPASDWYAVGVMLFEALTGRLPFRQSSAELLLAKQTEDAPQVASLAPAAPADLATLCDDLLARDPQSRPAAAHIHRVAKTNEAGNVQPPYPSTPSDSDASTWTPADPTGDTVESPSHSASGHGGTELSAAPAEAFVGRGRELAKLETALADTDGGKPVLVLVKGPSGIGKTTFVEHFISATKARGDAVVLSGRCYQRESVPFKGFDGMVDALSRFLVRLPGSDAARLVPRQAAALVRVFPVLGRVKAIASAPQRRGLPSDAVELRYRAFEALKELLAKLAEERPLILSIDDLQWSDRDSARLLKHLLTPPNPPMLLLLATHRDDEVEGEGLVAVREAIASDSAGDDVDLRQVELGPLSEAESRRLAQQLVAEPDRERAERIVREASGSPFLIGELVRAFRSDDNPGDLRRAILTRVETLPPAVRDVLHAICVAPRPVAPELLARVVGQKNLRAGLRLLVAARLSRQVAGHSDRAGVPESRQRLAAYHGRIRETVLEAMATAQLAGWHRRYTTELAGAETPDYDALVEHALGAGDRAAGGDYARRAARQAARALAFDRAVVLFELALLHLDLTPTACAELLAELAQAQMGTGRCADAARTFMRAAELDSIRGQEFRRRAGEQFFISGDIEAGSDAIGKALAEVGLDYNALLDPDAVMPSYQRLAAGGFEFQPRAEDQADPEDLARLDTLWAAALGTAYLVEAPALILAYLENALAVGEPFRVARGRALLLVAFESTVLDPAGTRERLPGLLSLLESVGTAPARAWAALCRGACAFWSGAGDLGHAELLQAEEMLTARDTPGMTRELNLCRSMLVAAELNTTGIDQVRERCVRYIRLAEETGDSMGSAQWRTATYHLLYDTEGADRVRAEIQRGLCLVESLDSSPQKGNGLMVFAIVDALEGQLEGALERTSKALESAGSGRQWVNLRFRVLRAQILLAAARTAQDREPLLERVERDAAVLARPITLSGAPVQYPVLAGYAEFLEGQVAAARGQQGRALSLFERALALAEGWPSQLPMFQARYGDLLGGARGAQLRADAETAMVAYGYRSPRWMELFAVRFEKSSSLLNAP